MVYVSAESLSVPMVSARAPISRVTSEKHPLPAAP